MLALDFMFPCDPARDYATTVATLHIVPSRRKLRHGNQRYVDCRDLKFQGYVCLLYVISLLLSFHRC